MADVNDDSPVVNQRLLEAEEAAQKAASGEWTPEEFEDFIEELSQALQKREEDIRQIEIPPEAVEDFREELEVGFRGIQLWHEGVARMALFTEEMDVTHLEEGLELCGQGNEHINEAMRINRDNRRKLEEIYRDSSTMM